MCLFFISGLLFLISISFIFGFYEKKAYAKIHSQIYQKRKSPNSKGGFGLERTGKIN